MPKVWTDEEVQAEIKAAHDIWASDYEKDTLNRLKAKYDTQAEPKDGDKTPPKKGDETQEGTTEQGEEKKTKRSLWWGEVEE